MSTAQKTNICITADLAIAVGQIAKHHPTAGIEIIWRDGQPEQQWLVLAHVHEPDLDFHAYLVDDESGSYVVAHNDTLKDYLR
jgi:hypothetical protein